MKKISIILVFVFTTGFISCTKQKIAADSQGSCALHDPPAWCATVRCSPDGKPVCGCNNVTYGSVCEAQCSGITSYTMGACK